MRTSNSICLLCQESPADKENSHIVPKFMTKSMFGTEGPRSAVAVTTNRIDKPYDYPQDSPKESRILCTSCEKYFEGLETLIANQLHSNLRKKKFNGHFDIRHGSDGTTYVECVKIKRVPFLLFLYSVVWRSHITSMELFEDFRIPVHYSSQIREILSVFKNRSYNSCSAEEAESVTIPKFQFMLITAKEFNDPTWNIILADELNSVWQLVMNEYMLYISFVDSNGIPQSDYLNSQSNENIKVALFEENLWIEVVKKLAELNLEK